MNHSEEKKQSLLPSNFPVLIILLILFLFPLIFAPNTTDVFILPKEVIIVGSSLLLFIFAAIFTVKAKTVRLHFTPFDIPLILLGASIILSGVFAVNQWDALISMVPVIGSIFFYFIITNTIRTPEQKIQAITAVVLSGLAVSILAILSFLKVFVLPFPFTHIQTFTPFGSLLDQILYLVIVLTIAGSNMMPIFTNKKKLSAHSALFLLTAIIIVIGIALSVYDITNLHASQSGFPLLPIETGLQTGFAAISQDTGRVFKSFFFGTGYGSFSNDFTRFKLPTFNLNQDLWSFTFFKSSSFFLELLATTGILGIISFIFLTVRFIKTIKISSVQNSELFLACIIVLAAAFLLPFSYTLITFFFLLFGLFSSSIESVRNQELKNEFFDADIRFSMQKSRSFLGLTKEVLSTNSPFYEFQPPIANEGTHQRFEILPIIISVIILVCVGTVGYYSYKFILSDTIFQQSLVAATTNNGLQTYTLENTAITTFPYRDGYHRIFSQVNYQLANSLAAQQPKGSSPSAETQQTIYTLIQQSINEGRSATTISPQTATNWQNLASLYKNLIGFGKNAEQFAVLAQQQAVALDPNNPQEYVSLGGIYYQLGQWDNAERQFQVAISLKSDYANAYYNLGHTLEQKGDYQNAKLAYETVRSLVADQQSEVKSITAEIDAVDQKIGSQKQTQSAPALPVPTPVVNKQQQPLSLSTQSAQLPQQKSPVQLPPPTASQSAR